MTATAHSDPRAPDFTSRGLGPGQPRLPVPPVVTEPEEADGPDGPDGEARALVRASTSDELVRASTSDEQVHDEAPVGDLVVGIAQESRRLLAKYVELAKFDVRRELLEARAAVLFTTLTVAVGMVGLVLLGFAASAWIVGAFGWPPAAAHGIVGTVILTASAFVWWLAARRVREVEVPEAVDEAKEDAEWIRDNV